MELIERNCVIFDIEEKEKNGVIIKLVEKLKESRKIGSEELFIEDVIAREDLSPTSMGYEIAIPHGKSDTVITPGICIGRVKEPVLWNEETGENAKIIILIAVPKKDESNIHLKIISKLARKLMHDDFRNILLNENEEFIYKLIKNELEV